MFLETALSLIMTFEGCHHVRTDGLVYAYLCPAGYPTQGYGKRVPSLDVPAITKEQAEVELKTKLIPFYTAHALRLSPNLIKHPKKLAAIVDFIYNLGPTAYASSTLRKRVNEEDWNGAATQVLRWNKAKGQVLKGLTKRCAARAQLLLS